MVTRKNCRKWFHYLQLRESRHLGAGSKHPAGEEDLRAERLFPEACQASCALLRLRSRHRALCVRRWSCIVTYAIVPSKRAKQPNRGSGSLWKRHLLQGPGKRVQIHTPQKTRAERSTPKPRNNPFSNLFTLTLMKWPLVKLLLPAQRTPCAQAGPPVLCSAEAWREPDSAQHTTGRCVLGTSAPARRTQGNVCARGHACRTHVPRDTHRNIQDRARRAKPGKCTKGSWNRRLNKSWHIAT